MTANISDYFNKASSMDGSYPTVALVASARSTGGTTLVCNSLAGWATDTPVHFSTFRMSSDGTIDAATQTDWKGIVSGNSITGLTRIAGATDSGNQVGDKVKLDPTIGWLDDLVTGILASHKQDGTLKDNAVTESSIADGAVTAGKLSLSYSTTEQATGKTWIDGKMIYVKTVDCGSLPNSTTKYKSHDISNLDKIIHITGIAHFPNYTLPLPCVADPLGSGIGVSGAIRVYANNSQIIIDAGYNRSGGTGYVTLYYTKTS